MATTTVNEDDLPWSEPAGWRDSAGSDTNNSDPSETVSGTITVSSPDGVVAAFAGGTVISTAVPPTSFADGDSGYTLTASLLRRGDRRR